MKKTLQKLLNELSARFPDISFHIRFPDGQILRFGTGEPSFVLNFLTDNAIKNVLSRGSLGFGEEYVAGTIEVEGDFGELIRFGLDPRFQDLNVSLGTKISLAAHHITSLNTVGRSPKNIARAYDLGNDFYKLYLDESMTYSCAYFQCPDDTLERAQQQKYEHICRKLSLAEGERLIDIGCGWGGMLRYAARTRGIRGTGCTLSPNQAAYAREMIEKDGLGDQVTIVQGDYRNLSGQFDKLVSIGMFEHVGKRFIPQFMSKIVGLIKPQGLGLLHTVGKETDTAGDPWTMKYIFPGAYIPVLDHVVRLMGQNGLVPLDIENLRLHYAATLDEWARRLETNGRKVEAIFDAALLRMWRLFLQGSAGAFRWGKLRLYQILFSNGIHNELPLTREHLYR